MNLMAKKKIPTRSGCLTSVAIRRGEGSKS